MAGEHFEKIPLDLSSLDNKTLDKRCNFLQNISNEENFKDKLSKVMGAQRAQDILDNQDIITKF